MYNILESLIICFQWNWNVNKTKAKREGMFTSFEKQHIFLSFFKYKDK